MDEEGAMRVRNARPRRVGLNATRHIRLSVDVTHVIARDDDFQWHFPASNIAVRDPTVRSSTPRALFCVDLDTRSLARVVIRPMTRARSSGTTFSSRCDSVRASTEKRGCETKDAR